MRQQPMGVLDGAFASLDGDIHASVSLRGEPRGAGDRDNGIAGHQHDIDAARKQRGIDREPLEQVHRLDRRPASTAVPSMPGPRNSKVRPLRQAFDLQDQRGRTIRIFIAAEREAIERGKRLRHRRSAQNCRSRDPRSPARWCGISAILSRPRSRTSRVEPDRRIVIEQGQRDRRRAAHHRRRRAGGDRDALHAAGARHRIHHRAEGRLRRQHLVGETLRAVRQPSSSLSPHRAPACRNRPASPRSRPPFGPARRSMAARSGASTLASTASGKFIRLHQRVAQRDHPRLLPVAAERVAKADFAGRKPHRRARHRGLAEIERRAVAADAAAHHHQAVFRLAQILRKAGTAMAPRRPAMSAASECASTAIAALRCACLPFSPLAVISVLARFGSCRNQVVYDTRQLDSDAP